MKTIAKVTLGSVCFMLSILCACGNPEGVPNQTASSTQAVSFGTFADNLENLLRDKSVGYSFTISYLNHRVEARSGGQARTAADSPALAMSPQVKFSTASLSKTITAAAAVKLLDQSRIRGGRNHLNDPIGRYLPADFNADASFQSITFKQLLQHKSGIGTSTDATGVDYASIRDYVRAHPNVTNKTYMYSNTNYALFRFLIPAIANIRLQSGDRGLAYGVAFNQYVQQNILNPAGLLRMSSASDRNTGINYHFRPPAQPPSGMDLGDLTALNASQGWVMSTDELAQFLRELHYSSDIVPPELAQEMKDSCLGYNICGQTVTPQSAYQFWWKNGFYPGCWGSNAGEFQGSLVVFNNYVSVALIVNSNLAYRSVPDGCQYQDGSPNLTGGSGPLQAILDAFDATFGSGWERAVPPRNCRGSVGCGDSVTVLCDMIDEVVVLQRQQPDNTWLTVSRDDRFPRYIYPSLSDLPLSGDRATYRACTANFLGDNCAPPFWVRLPHDICGGGGNGGQRCGLPPLPRCETVQPDP